MADPFDEAVAALAKLENKTPEQVRIEMVRERFARAEKGKAEPPEPPPRALARTEERRPARRDEDDGGETPEEAEQRWIEEETMLPDGLFGLGGQTAGGIFGGGPIATSTYDPESLARGESRVGHALQLQMARTLERVAGVLDRVEANARPPLPEGRVPRRRLPR